MVMSIRVTRRESTPGLGEIEQAQPRQVESLEQALLRVLPLDLSQLLRRHFTPVRSERAIHFTPDEEQRLLISICGDRRGHFVFEHGESPLEVFEIERPRRINQR